MTIQATSDIDRSEVGKKRQTFSLTKPRRTPTVWGFDVIPGGKAPKWAVGDRIEVVEGDGTRHPELAGRRGVISLIRADYVLIEIEGGGGTYKNKELWWKRIDL